ncbi:MAG: hypothetical protein FWG19_03085 [Methanomassiliicoccaceae archaeon]|nr:hypothetical protein [Methanomassiliicoccaceae archaeon]
MMMILRNMEYEDLLNTVRGRNVVIWTCNTCARICNGIGGKESAARLAAKLKEDGVNVLSSMSTSAGCLMSKVTYKAPDIPDDADVIISLTCDVGVTCASKAFRKDVVAPFATVGTGFVDDDGTLVVTSSSGAETNETLGDIAKKKGMSTVPLV